MGTDNKVNTRGQSQVKRMKSDQTQEISGIEEDEGDEQGVKQITIGFCSLAVSFCDIRKRNIC